MNPRCATAIIVVCISLTGCPRPDPMSRDDVAAEVRRRIDAAADAGFSGTVSITWRGQPLVASAHGFAARR